MRSRIWKFATIVSALALGFAMMPSAKAVCGLPTNLARPSSWQPTMPGAHFAVVAMGDDFDNGGGPSIVGMWHVVFTATTSNGASIPATVVDNALSVWHRDKTEIMNSVRAPQDGNFCLGVWEQTGARSYYLNHVAWFANAFPNDTANGIGAPMGPTSITERVTVSSGGNKFTGTFTLKAYDTTGTVVQTFTGTLAGTRITTNTTVPSLM